MKFKWNNSEILFVYILLSLTIIFWGFSFIIVHIAVEYISPLSLALYRLVIASITLLFIDFTRKLKKKKKLVVISIDNSPKLRLNFWILIIFASFAGVSFYLFFLYSAVELIGPSIPSLYDCLVAPVFIVLFSIIFFREKVNKLKIFGFMVASIGSFLLITGGDINKLNPSTPSFLGYVFILFTPLLWATYSIIIKKIELSYGTKSDFKNLKYITYFGCIELFIFVLICDQLAIFLINFLNIILILCGIYLGLICFVFGYFSWNYAHKKIQSSKVASFLYIEPFITLFFSFLFHRNEVIVIWNILGGVLVLIAVIIINYQK